MFFGDVLFVSSSSNGKIFFVFVQDLKRAKVVRVERGFHAMSPHKDMCGLFQCTYGLRSVGNVVSWRCGFKLAECLFHLSDDLMRTLVFRWAKEAIGEPQLCSQGHHCRRRGAVLSEGGPEPEHD